MRDRAGSLEQMPRESQLILASVGGKIARDPAEVAELAAHSIDWNEFLAEAKAKRLAALIYHNWQVAKISNGLPQAVVGKLKETHYQMLYRNLAAERFVSQILKELVKENEIVILKGLALLNTVYDSVAVRTFCDVDLLIKREETEKVEEIIRELDGTIVMRSRCETTYRLKLPKESGLKESLLFDVSWEITSSQRFAATTKWDLERLWERSVAVNIGDIAARTLSPEDTLVHLCYHVAFRHLFQTSEVRWYVDLHQIISRCQLDWQDIVNQAKDYGISTVVYTALSLAKNLLGTQIPAWVFEELGAKRPARWIISPLVRHPINVTAGMRGDFWYLATQSLLLDRPSQLIKVGAWSLRPGLKWLKRKREKKSSVISGGRE